MQTLVKNKPKAVKPKRDDGDSQIVDFIFDRPEAQRVAVAGTFNNWNPAQTPMTKGSDGRWRATVVMPAGRHEYKFVIDGQWMNDPKAQESVPNPFGGCNSVIVARKTAQ